MPRKPPPQTSQPSAPDPQELRQQLLDEAQRLRSLAVAVRARLEEPNAEQYLQSGRGPAYQRACEAWVRNVAVAFAFDNAAYRLEEELGSSRCRRA